ncbi:hypothetical protein AX774_g3627 [Zancudomyces culisetae]|uniref:Uncharacterized protein n=1 Tax=Zancudomyces culisetae TaxID=1213189 RepID=A0A1R1PPK4_ZANCU|nr:hypothetical protein AX774_g3627 [Zancudomyces culisetae]|eukprot:OMH82880.1 hypothetical protein AX774_g3627 [Zancudomyces culisetae]
MSGKKDITASITEENLIETHEIYPKNQNLTSISTLLDVRKKSRSGESVSATKKGNGLSAIGKEKSIAPRLSEVSAVYVENIYDPDHRVSETTQFIKSKVKNRHEASIDSHTGYYEDSMKTMLSEYVIVERQKVFFNLDNSSAMHTAVNGKSSLETKQKTNIDAQGNISRTSGNIDPRSGASKSTSRGIGEHTDTTQKNSFISNQLTSLRHQINKLSFNSTNEFKNILYSSKTKIKKNKNHGESEVSNVGHNNIQRGAFESSASEAVPTSPKRVRDSYDVSLQNRSSNVFRHAPLNKKDKKNHNIRGLEISLPFDEGMQLCICCNQRFLKINMFMCKAGHTTCYSCLKILAKGPSKRHYEGKAPCPLFSICGDAFVLPKDSDSRNTSRDKALSQIGESKAEIVEVGQSEEISREKLHKKTRGATITTGTAFGNSGKYGFFSGGRIISDTRLDLITFLKESGNGEKNAASKENNTQANVKPKRRGFSVQNYIHFNYLSRNKEKDKNKERTKSTSTTKHNHAGSDVQLGKDNEHIPEDLKNDALADLLTDQNSSKKSYKKDEDFEKILSLLDELEKKNYSARESTCSSMFSVNDNRVLLNFNENVLSTFEGLNDPAKEFSVLQIQVDYEKLVRNYKFIHQKLRKSSMFSPRIGSMVGFGPGDELLDEGKRDQARMAGIRYRPSFAGRSVFSESLNVQDYVDNKTFRKIIANDIERKRRITINRSRSSYKAHDFSRSFSDSGSMPFGGIYGPLSKSEIDVYDFNYDYTYPIQDK